jgi:hypothetical protein
MDDGGPKAFAGTLGKHAYPVPSDPPRASIVGTYRYPHTPVPLPSSTSPRHSSNLRAGSNKMANYTGKGGFKKGESGNPSGSPKLPGEMKEMFQAKASEAFEVLCKHLHAKDPRVCVAAATQILDRACRSKRSTPISMRTTAGFASMPKFLGRRQRRRNGWRASDGRNRASAGIPPAPAEERDSAKGRWGWAKSSRPDSENYVSRTSTPSGGRGTELR